MAITLKKVTNIGVRCGSITLPMIKAVVELDSASETTNKALMEEIYTHAMGMVSTCALFFNPVQHPDYAPQIQSYTTGSKTIGGTTGFKVTYDVGAYRGVIRAVNPVEVYYDNTSIGNQRCSTGYANMEVRPLVIFVNDNNDVYGCGSLYIGCTEDPGIADNNGITAYALLTDYPLIDISVAYKVLAETGYNITNDIENEIDPSTTDPYEAGGGESGPGGGTGTFSETGDTIGIPGLPALSAVDTGFITLFNPNAAQVKALANYMWSSSFDLATFKNIVANPIDCILGLSIVPVDPPNAGTKTVNVGNIPTDVTLPYLSSQYVEVDCGTLNVQEFWGSYLDYSPYTKMSLYLPYIGIIPLDIDDVMNASIAVKYHVDVLSGACVAYVLCNGTQLYTYVGQCSSNVPITSNDFTNTVNGILGIAGSIGKLAADGGASAPTEAAGIAANAINALKPNIQKSGAMSGTGGLMGVQTPYLICQRPRQSVPASQNSYTGYPANITAKLSDLSGYTEVDNIHLDGLSATQEEQQEIMDLLTSGVII